MKSIRQQFSLFVLTLIALFVFSSNYSPQEIDTLSLSDLLIQLGEEKPKHFIDASTEQIERGKALVLNGKTRGPDGKRGKYISKYYVCTSCHNTQREDEDLTTIDPEKRLEYAVKNNIPYLQGSTFWGIVNRESWYNDEYIEKYGDLVKPARESLRESIKLCAIECSQGRPLEEWEVESILAYFWTLEMKVNDLGLSKKDLNQLVENVPSTKELKATARKKIHSKYLNKSPAHFEDTPKDLNVGYGLKGDVTRGKILFDKSCMHCHKNNGVSNSDFDHSKFTMKKFENNLGNYTDWGLYQIVRKGTYAQSGHKPYMPHFTREKMSNQQVEDLRAYIISAAN